MFKVIKIVNECHLKMAKWSHLVIYIIYIVASSIYRTKLELASSCVTSWVDLNKIDIIEQSCIARYVTVTYINQYNRRITTRDIYLSLTFL